MKHHITFCALVATSALLLAGCEQTVTKEIHVQPPAAAPAPVAQETLRPLPMAASTSWMNPPERPAIDVLVEGVQSDYEAGQAQYKAGNLDQAQADFDHAVDRILKGGFQADADARLGKLFDQLSSVVNSDELSAMQGTNQEEAEAPAEPAPIDEIADLTLPAGDPRLAAKAESELIRVHHDLPLTVNESVLQYLSFFTTTRGRAIVEHGLDRAGRYSDMIRRVLAQEGVPQDMIYLAQAESAFQPDAVSRAGARGIWQFMPFRGEEYDLDRSYWVDDRSDPEKATRAAARHFRDLYAMFGDWYLVMAAYNSGPLTVARAVQRTGYADFWELQRLNALPKQTQNYVPIILAMALVAKDPALYGVQVSPEKPAEVEAVHLEHPIDLHLVADASGTDFDDLRLLNPQLLRSVTPNESDFTLKLPADATKNFEENIAQVPQDKWTSWRLHEMGDGETLAEVARRYRVTVAAIESANHLEPQASVPSGFFLNVPTVPAKVRFVRYRVERGDTLPGIADRFDVTVDQLRRWNHIRGSRVSRGERLRIYAGEGDSPAAAPAKARSAESQKPETPAKTVSAEDRPAQGVEHRVKPGETLYSIARVYQTSVSALREWNPFLSDRELQAGDVLMIQR
ncbi:MAG TPA: LysM peptidoglycan-binding domain-containing protein [Candidatus Acidoferrales bacterium]|jgi:membrane-bound lytic murein transglycosylase D|nr:LysM peptidoglycan-binding domain-containing protein [Candidatus Acidoferrales bacterium]